MRLYQIITYGCQMNDRDSEILAGLLEKRGFRAASGGEQANLILLNTCCVRKSAEDKLFGKLHELRLVKQQNPEIKIAVGGCVPQLPSQAAQIAKRFPHVDLIFGTFNSHQLDKLLDRLDASQQVCEVWESAGPVQEELPSKRKTGIRAQVSIIAGCDNFCSYCAVPMVRGRERSRHPDRIQEEIREAASQGFREVLLLGQNVNSYGKDLGNASFAKLLRQIDRIEAIDRIRFMTSHPRDLSMETIETIREGQRICEHIHLPLQSGSNRILEIMNRKYSQMDYLRLIDNIRKVLPEASLTTDIIVGFPGEENSDFQETLKTLKIIGFDAAFTFMYSPRPGTLAARMKDTVSMQEKKSRLQELMKVQAEIGLHLNQRLVEREVEVLVEGPSKSNPNRLMGRTRTNKIVIFDAAPSLIGKTLKVQIVKANSWSLYGAI